MAADMMRRSLEAHETPAPVKNFKDELSAYMSKLGQKGGKVSGARRKTNLSDEHRQAIASRAARVRWRRPWRSTTSSTIFIKIHDTLRVTPAMAAGVTNRFWEVSDWGGCSKNRSPKKQRE